MKAAKFLVIEGEILTDSHHPLELHFGGRVVAHRMQSLGSGRRGAQQIRIGLPLGEIVSRRQAERWQLLLLDVVVDGVKLEGRERTKNEIDFVTLDQLLGFGLGAGRRAAGIGGNEIDLAPRDRVVGLLQKGQHALFHLDAALGKRPDLYGKKTDFDRRRLGDRGRGKTAESGGGSSAGEKRPATDLARHHHLLRLAPLRFLRALCCARYPIIWHASHFALAE